jgi:hypothetical protein
MADGESPDCVTGHETKQSGGGGSYDEPYGRCRWLRNGQRGRPFQ